MTDFLDPEGKFGMSFKNALDSAFPEHTPEPDPSGVGPWWLDVLWSQNQTEESYSSWRRSASHGAPRGFPTLHAAWANWVSDPNRRYLVPDEDHDLGFGIFRIRFTYSPGKPPEDQRSVIHVIGLGEPL